MAILVNQEMVNDAVKLMMHRLISREMRRDASLIERTRMAHSQVALRYVGHSFVQEWNDLLKLPSAELRTRLTSRDSEMARMRLTSPFVLAVGVHFTDYHFRLRLRRAARRVVERGLACRARSSSPVA
jgi:hypothetical protein